MSRSMGTSALTALGSAQTAIVFVSLLSITLTVDSEEITKNFINDRVGITSNGIDYLPLAFNVTLPSEGDQIQSAQVTMDAVDLVVVEAVRKSTTTPKVTFRIITTAYPDDTEAGPFDFELREVTYNAKQLSGTLTRGNHLEGMYPKILKTPLYFPGLF